jgi:hypothetical protein
MIPRIIIAVLGLILPYVYFINYSFEMNFLAGDWVAYILSRLAYIIVAVSGGAAYTIYQKYRRKK